MISYLIRRLVQSLVVLAGLSVVFFALLAATPGDPLEVLASQRPDLLPEDVARLRAQYGLDDPLPVRYLKWLRSVVRGDLGYSRTYSEPVATLVARRLGATMQLAGAAFALGVLGGVVLGILAAARPRSAWDYAATGLSVAGLSVPVFWLGIVAILAFAVWLRWLPAGGMMTPGVEAGLPALADRARHLVLPTVVLAAGGMAAWARYTRAGVLEALGQDYIRTARAKGVADGAVMRRHALRNALLPLVTLAALAVPRLLDGAVVAETVFSWPGMGLLLYQAVLGHDYPVAMAVLMLLAAVTVLANLAADVAYAAVDPRIRYG
ncbi:MAG: ABC transporter permease [Armatimonadota bacterium]|nr:ABC transporter permease [Armatimonadota bacterium]MDR7437215.1 ABC transporter permease [Armatimonadota bacterium]MDR7473015.1 ABC transporter permease [Armatimonadota bacterium]MDR7506187.1 ABC transporter permease [Armatimonadota bacterium]MDR7509108.1 ABC transporter permease [Armatimonadota bacterium]